MIDFGQVEDHVLAVCRAAFNGALALRLSQGATISQIAARCEWTEARFRSAMLFTEPHTVLADLGVMAEAMDCVVDLRLIDRRASRIEAAPADETRSGSAEGESLTGEAGDAQSADAQTTPSENPS